MPETENTFTLEQFSAALFEWMACINPGIAEMELYEFRYALDNIAPAAGWASVEVVTQGQIEELIRQERFYRSIQLRPVQNHQIVLDPQIVQLTQALFAGLVAGLYPPEWVKQLFYFDIRGFYFLARTSYYSQAILDHFGGIPYHRFQPTQQRFEKQQEIGYREFGNANKEVDQAFIATVQRIIRAHGVPILLTLAGPSAAGKTEIVKRLRCALEQEGKSITTIEMDNFFKDRAFRDGKGLNKDVIHFELFRQNMRAIRSGHRISIPQYDFVHATSSHDLESKLKPGRAPLEIEPSDIIFLEGNFPFHLEEIADLIDIKIMYLTDDPIRLKRKWKRDVDYRKKYNPNYLCNRFFQIQFLRAKEVYRPLMEVCDVLVDTSAAALWVAPETATAIAIPADIPGDNPIVF